MLGGVRGGQRHGDQEVGGGEAEQHQHEQLAQPLGQQPLQHRDGTLAAEALPGHPAVHRQRAEQGQQHQHDGGQRGEQAGGQGGDARLVAERGEVVDAGQAHHLPPAVLLVRGLRGLARALVGCRACRPGPPAARPGTGWAAAVCGRGGGGAGGSSVSSVRSCGRRSWPAGRLRDQGRGAQPVLGLDGADRAAARSHGQRLGDRQVRRVPDPAQHLAVGDAGGDEVRVVAADQVRGGEHPVQVVAEASGLVGLRVVARRQPAVDRAAQAADGAGGDDALRGAADPDQQVDLGLGLHRHQRAGDVAVDQELDPGADGADLADQVGVPGPVQQRNGDIGDADPARPGDGGQGGLDRRGEVDGVHQVRPDDQLVHVDAGTRVEHRAPVGQRDHRHRVRQALGGQPGAVDRIDGDVHQRPGAGAEVLAGVQHRGVVLLALADDDDAAHRDGAEHRPHRVDRGAVDLVLVAAAEEPAAAIAAASVARTSSRARIRSSSRWSSAVRRVVVIGGSFPDEPRVHPAGGNCPRNFAGR